VIHHPMGRRRSPARRRPSSAQPNALRASLTNRRALVLVTVAIAALAVVTATRSSVTLPTDAGSDTPAILLPVTQVQGAQLHAFSVFHRPRQAPSATMQEAIRRALTASRPLGLNLDLARRVSTRIGVAAWIVPGNGFICVIRDITGTAGCNTTEETIAHGMSLLETEREVQPVRSSQYILLGIAPDKVTRVDVIPDVGKAQTVSVHDNVFAYRSALPVRARLVR